MKDDRIKPMLATLADKPFSDKDWIYEIKWDGYRAIAHIEKGNVDLYSRNFTDFNSQYPTLTQSLSKIKEDVILDGEIIASTAGKFGFQALQNVGQVPTKISFMVFDVLSFNGKDTRMLPLMERKKILRKILNKYKKLENIAESDYVEGDGEKLFALAVKQDLEGIMAKRKNSVYRSDRRTDDWLKMKHHKTDEGIIAGFTEPRGSRHKFGALVLGQYDRNGEFTYIGHTGTGFNNRSLDALYAKMLKLKASSSPFKDKVPLNAPVTWIKPKLIAQLKFAEWTEDKIMRQPVYLGLRSDKNPENIIREEEVKAENVMNKIIKKETKKQSDTRKDNQEFTNLDKVYFPKLQITKGDVINYYEKISSYILPYLKDRPETLNRHPGGINKPNFFHKNFTTPVPSFAHTTKIHSDSNNEDLNYLVCNNKDTLLYMANLGCIEINAWNSRVEKIDYPDYMIIDIDPGDNTWAELIKVAKEVKKVLDGSCQKSYLKTSGKSGLHICVPFGAKYSFDEVRTFSELVSRVVHQRLPELTSLDRSPALRKKKIYLDYLQNRVGQTTASVYSLRPTPEATVSTPLKWSELTLKLNPKKFTIFTVPDRIKKIGDIWKPVIKESVNLKKSITCLEKSLR